MMGNVSEYTVPASDTCGLVAADAPDGRDTTARSSQQDANRSMDFLVSILEKPQGYDGHGYS
jgi:hypothetical protein